MEQINQRLNGAHRHVLGHRLQHEYSSVNYSPTKLKFVDFSTLTSFRRFINHTPDFTRFFSYEGLNLLCCHV